MDWRDIQGKTAFITGASSGIGAHAAREFAKLGCNVALAARRKDKLDRLVEELTEFGCKAKTVVCDVTQPKTIAMAVDKTHQELGDIHIVFANAGFGVRGTVEELTTEDYRRQFEVNVFGVLETIYATLDDLKKTHGRLAVMGSVAGYLTAPASTAYNMSKHAVKALTLGMRHELKHHGISVTLISPGFVQSEFFSKDNHGNFKAASKDEKTAPMSPEWMRAPADKAAKQIVDGIIERKREVKVTRHGWFAIHMSRLFPRTIESITALKLKQPKSGEKS